MVAVAIPTEAPTTAKIQIKPHTEQLYAMVQGLHRLSDNSTVDMPRLLAKFVVSQEECPPALDYKFIFQSIAGAAMQLVENAAIRNPQASFTQAAAIFRSADNFLNELIDPNKRRSDLPIYDYYDVMRVAAIKAIETIPQAAFKDQFRPFIKTFARPTLAPINPLAEASLPQRPQPRFRELDPSLTGYEREIPSYPLYDFGEA